MKKFLPLIPLLATMENAVAEDLNHLKSLLSTATENTDSNKSLSLINSITFKSDNFSKYLEDFLNQQTLNEITNEMYKVFNKDFMSKAPKKSTEGKIGNQEITIFANLIKFFNGQDVTIGKKTFKTTNVSKYALRGTFKWILPKNLNYNSFAVKSKRTKIATTKLSKNIILCKNMSKIEFLKEFMVIMAISPKTFALKYFIEKNPNSEYTQLSLFNTALLLAASKLYDMLTTTTESE